MPGCLLRSLAPQEGKSAMDLQEPEHAGQKLPQYNCYPDTAWLYDFNTSFVITEDVPFYIDLAREEKASRVLELACGTGRVSIPLAQAGFFVTGLELSPPMRKVFGDKLGQLEASVSDRIQIVAGSMAEFQLDKLFDFILIPFRAFQALEERDAARCLHCVREHLAPGGFFVVEVFRPVDPMDEGWEFPELLQWEKTDPATGLSITKKAWGGKPDQEKQLIYPGYAYEYVDRDGIFRRLEERLRLRYYYRDQLRDMLEAAGFTVAAEYGWYDRRPVEKGTELILLCR